MKLLLILLFSRQVQLRRCSPSSSPCQSLPKFTCAGMGQFGYVRDARRRPPMRREEGVAFASAFDLPGRRFWGTVIFPDQNRSFVVPAKILWIQVRWRRPCQLFPSHRGWLIKPHLDAWNLLHFEVLNFTNLCALFQTSKLHNFQQCMFPKGRNVFIFPKF